MAQLVEISKLQAKYVRAKILLETHELIMSGISSGVSIFRASRGSVRMVCSRCDASSSGGSAHP